MLLKPEISVILSTYNRNRPSGDCRSLVTRAISSILNQTFFDFELILIDDASSDGTEEVCLKFARQDCRISYIRHKCNSQLPAKRYNEGMALSQGRFIAFMFDDDEWLPSALADLYTYFTTRLETQQDIGMIYGLTTLFDVKLNKIFEPSFGAEWDLKAIHAYNFLANCSVLVRKDVIDRVGGYDEAKVMRRICDWDLWQRIGKVYSVERIPKQVAIVYQCQPDSIGLTVPLNKKLIMLRQILRWQLPLQTKKLSSEQKKRFIRSLIRIWSPLPAIRLSFQNSYVKIKRLSEALFKFSKQMGKRCVKSLFMKLGCWNYLKTIYDQFKT